MSTPTWPKALVFDLDDTLYDESTYVRSGFREVASYLGPLLGSQPEELFKQMMKVLKEEGRGRVFDVVLESGGRASKGLVRTCVSTYRKHRPTISLSGPAERCLSRFRNIPLYVVTDGNKTAQAAKVEALGVAHLVKRVFITHRFGRRHAKPSPYCFQMICKLEAASPGEVIYLGDNPRKDFCGIRPLGFRTIRILTGVHARVGVEAWRDAEICVRSLDEVTHALLKRLQNT